MARQYRAGVLCAPQAMKGQMPAQGASLLPITVLGEPEKQGATPDAPRPAAATIEIELNGARVRVIGMVDPLQLRLVLRCLMPA
ncbi:MAG: hypothetical protein ACT4PG_01385 [Panacagrimonas sp.]